MHEKCILAYILLQHYLIPKAFEKRAIYYFINAVEASTDDTKTFLVYGMYLQGLICEILKFHLMPGDSILFSECELE